MDVEEEIVRLENLIKNKPTYGNEAIYNYITNNTEIISGNQFTEEQKNRLIKFLDDNERIAKIQKQLNMDTTLHQMSKATVSNATKSMPKRTGPSPYSIANAGNLFTNMIKDYLIPATIIYEIEFFPLKYIGDLNLTSEDRVIILKSKVLMDQHVIKTLGLEGNNLYIEAGWKWKTVPTDTKTGVGVFDISITDSNKNSLLDIVWDDMLLFDVFTWHLIISSRVYIVGNVTNTPINGDIVWSPKTLENEKYTSSIIIGTHVSRSKLMIEKDPANYAPPVLITDAWISDIVTFDGAFKMVKENIPTIETDVYLNYQIGIGVHPTGYDWMPDDLTVNEKAMNMVMETDLEEIACYDAIQICRSQEVAYLAQLERDQQELIDLDVGLDSSIFTNLGSQIATLYKMYQRTIQYEEVEIDIKRFTISEYVPGIISYGGGGSNIHEVSRDGGLWTDKDVFYDVPMGYKWSAPLESGRYTIYWGITRTAKHAFNGVTREMEHVVDGEISILMKYTIAAAPPEMISHDKELNYRNMVIVFDKLYSNNDGYRIIHFDRILHKRTVFGHANTKVRSPIGKMKIPEVTATIDSMFISVANTTNEPILVNSANMEVQVLFGCQQYNINIVGLRPGQYNTLDGGKHYGFHCDLNQTTFRPTSIGHEVSVCMRLPDDESIYENESLDYKFKRKTLDEMEDGYYYFHYLNDLNITSGLGETIWADGNVAEARFFVNGVDTPTAALKGGFSLQYEPIGAYLMIEQDDQFSIPQSYPDIKHQGEDVYESNYWAGRLFETFVIELKKDYKLSMMAPRPPEPQDQLWIFDEQVDEIAASLEMLMANWMRDHEALMGLLDKINRMEEAQKELTSTADIQFWMDIAGAIIGLVIPTLPLPEISALIGSKLKSGFKKVFRRKGNAFSWRLADSLADSKYKKYLSVHGFGEEMMGDYRVADQTMKDITASSTGISKRKSYQIDQHDPNSTKDLFEISSIASHFEQPELLKTNVSVHTGLRGSKEMDEHIDSDAKLLDLLMENAATNTDVPMNTVKFFTTPLNMLGEPIGNFAFKHSRRNPNRFDQAGAEKLFKTDRKPVHAYVRAETYMPNQHNDGITCDVTYAGITEGFYNPDLDLGIGTITFRTNVKTQTADKKSWVLELVPFSESGYDKEAIEWRFKELFHFEPLLMDTEEQWQALWCKMNRRDATKAHLYYEHKAADPHRISALGYFAYESDWDYKLLSYNCQTFSRIMYSWIKDGAVPTDAHMQLLMQAYSRSVKEDANLFVNAVFMSLAIKKFNLVAQVTNKLNWSK